jgi:hypothetical protein
VKRNLAIALAWGGLVACTTDAIIIASREVSGADDASTDEGQSPDSNADANTESDAAASDDAAPPENACKTNDECGDGRYCQKERRDARYGRCDPRPIACAANQAPVCGSDNISYFNDCVRKKFGIAYADQGQCLTEGQVTRCGTLLSVGMCPVGTFCARLIPRSPADIPLPCDLDMLTTEGTCWGMPDDCDPPTSGRGGSWVLCPSVLTGGSFGGASPGGGSGNGPGGGSFGGGTFGGGTGGGNFGGGSLPPCVDTCTAIKTERVHVNDVPCSR